MAMKVFLSFVVLCSAFVSSIRGRFCSDTDDCLSNEVCCNNKCIKGSSCIGYECFGLSNCLQSESCCNDVCTFGPNCLGRRCTLDSDCRLPQEKCCVDKCVDVKSTDVCLSIGIVIGIALTGLFLLILVAVIVYAILRRKRHNIQMQAQNQAIATATQQPYRQFTNEESPTVQGTVLSVPSPYQMVSHETATANDKGHVESSPTST